MLKKVILTIFMVIIANSVFAFQVTPTNVNFTNADGLVLDGKLFSPSNPPQTALPAVIMLHGCAGIYNSYGNITEIYREWGDRLTAAGYIALLVDSYNPRHNLDPNVALNQCKNITGVEVSEIFDRPKDVAAARKYLATLTAQVNAAKIGVLGWSNGGSTVLSSLSTIRPITTNGVIANPDATKKPLKVGVAFYAGCGLADYRCGTQSNGNPASCFGGLSTSKWDSYAPFIFLHGSLDTTVSAANCSTRATKATAIRGGGVITLTIYDGAVHSFDDLSVGGGTCVDQTSTPNSCAKQQADVAALNTLNQYLK